jgi:hypothetical protein
MGPDGGGGTSLIYDLVPTTLKRRRGGPTPNDRLTEKLEGHYLIYVDQERLWGGWRLQSAFSHIAGILLLQEYQGADPSLWSSRSRWGDQRHRACNEQTCQHHETSSGQSLIDKFGIKLLCSCIWTRRSKSFDLLSVTYATNWDGRG